jgi:predicted Zn-dependent protease
MFSNKLRLPFLMLLLILQSCSEIPVAPRISVREQLEVDTRKAAGLVSEFKKQGQFISSPAVEKYLESVALQIVAAEEEMRGEKVQVRIHQDSRREWKRSFGFPGILIWIPRSFLDRVNFENELAALVAYQLALVKNRELAKAIERDPVRAADWSKGGFDFSRDAIAASIELGIRMMYAAGYDPRGMVSLIEKNPVFFMDDSSSSGIKDREFLVKQAQKTKNEFMPSLQPIVRSNDFLRMKKELKGSS